MGYDHAEQRELDPPVVASGSSSGSTTSDNEVLKEVDRPQEDDVLETETLDDDEEREPGRRHRRHHEGGILKLRAADDDLPSDWWFASTAIPLIAATFAPMANMISIGALVVSWRNNVVDPSDPIYYQATSVGYPDPTWCIDLNIASLVCGFVGNLFLLFNFTKRVRYIVALPLTIVLFYMAAAILIGITVAMHLHVPPGHNQVYSQGFWNAVIAACLYMFNSMILMANMGGYFLGHYPQHFTLTDEQRNLILQTMMFFIWLGGGGAVFARLEGWNYNDAVYFCDVTILTVGFGDIYPTTDVSRGIVFPFSVGGIIILGLMVSSIHKFAGELSTVNVLRKHVEKRRLSTLSRSVTVEDFEDRRREHLENEIEMQGEKLQISAPLPSPQIQRDLDAAAARALGRTSQDFADRDTAEQIADGSRVEMEDLEPIDTARERQTGPQIAFQSADIQKQQQEADQEPSPHQFMGHDFHKGPIHRTLRLITRPVTTLRRVRTKNTKVVLMREERDRFNAMRDIQEDARSFKKWFALFVSVIAFGTLWCVGAAVFWQAEKPTQGLSYFEALYFCYVSLLTIGYGDLSPKSNAGKPFFVLWSLIAVPTMTILISDMGDTVISSIKRGTFILGDMTILPKKGLWHDLLKANPWVYSWINKRSEKSRRKKGLPVGQEGDSMPPALSIEQLAAEEPSTGELTQRLAWAIRRTADDLQHAPRKRYSYEEWAEFTRLIRFTKEGLAQLEYDEETDGVVDWDWLEESSPMLSGQTEAEWILDRLCESLLRLLKKNMLGTDTALSASVTDFATFSPSGQLTRTDTDLMSPTSVKTEKGKDTAPEPPTAIQERRRRASGADALMTFFTGERRGDHAYAETEPQWSHRAIDKAKTRRRNSDGLKAVGGGRGGAGVRTLKMRHLTGNGKRFSPSTDDGTRFSPSTG
ncbi:potassium channel, subfamily K [Exophiala viscosa]|uniref:potassium channel, subfamily K n=1 Tax=Exophiala viscosa TaxID=2486360 RepID=UPI0021956790|nr:potassium channel, subfamily K [Exophiala viscosa]